MTQKQKIFAGSTVVLIVIGFVSVYNLYRGQSEISAVPVQHSGEAESVRPEPVPENPDGIADAIIDEALADAAALENESESEQSQIEADANSVNDLGNSYDETSF